MTSFVLIHKSYQHISISRWSYDKEIFYLHNMYQTHYHPTFLFFFFSLSPTRPHFLPFFGCDISRFFVTSAAKAKEKNEFYCSLSLFIHSLFILCRWKKSFSLFLLLLCFCDLVGKNFHLIFLWGFKNEILFLIHSFEIKLKKLNSCLKNTHRKKI